MIQSEALVAPLRVLAVLLSVGIGGYLVWAAQDRQRPAHGSDPEGGEQALELGTEPSRSKPSEAAAPRVGPNHDTEQPGSDPAKVFLPSSKNAFQRGQLWPLLESQPLPGAAEAAPEGSAINVDPVLLFSSKSAPINPEIFEPALKEADAEVAPQPRFLPSSKVIITPEMLPKADDRVFLSSSKSAPAHLIGLPPKEPDEDRDASAEPPDESTEEPAPKAGGSHR